jgi:hypothetical protein
MLKYKVCYKHWLFRFPPLKYYRGITLGKTILFRGTKEEVTKELLAHELVHRAQIERHGVLNFYFIYCRDYLRNLLKYRNHLEAYRNIPFEREAFEKQYQG